MSYERHLGTPPTKTLKPISRKKTLFCVEYSVWWVGVSASMPVEFVDDFGWGPCECCWSLNLFWKFVLLSAWTAEALALKCDVGIVMMTSKLKLWIKKRYVRVVCDVYCLFCLFVFDKKEKFAETRDRTRDLMIFSHTLSRLSYLGFWYLLHTLVI